MKPSSQRQKNVDRNIRINFDPMRDFVVVNIKSLIGICGLYFIALPKTIIPYPFARSRLVYIGMSEKRTNSIGKRLQEHYDGSSGNKGLRNYRKRESLLFTYLNFEMLARVWEYRIEDLESYFILDFLRQYGAYPICNNKSGFEVTQHDLNVTFDIDWSFFEEQVCA